MTDILATLKECAENERMPLSRLECTDAYIELKTLRRLNDTQYETIQSMLENNPDEKSIDSPTVNALKWTGRWSIFIVAMIATGFTLATWQWSLVYAAMLLTNGTIFLHAGVMLREWWAK